MALQDGTEVFEVQYASRYKTVLKERVPVTSLRLDWQRSRQGEARLKTREYDACVDRLEIKSLKRCKDCPGRRRNEASTLVPRGLGAVILAGCYGRLVISYLGSESGS